MAVYKSSDSLVGDRSSYRLDDFEQQKNDYLEKIRLQAKAILDEARGKARTLLQEAYKEGQDKAAKELAVQRLGALKKGHQDGLDKARVELEKEYQTRLENELKPLLKSVAELAGRLDSEIHQLVSDAEKHLIACAF
ncbi:MAG: hypothetical protein HQL31_14450, partial [Planctomycetes bacterium]|nr:hypothetical protein [Planctomycetota bacterium]